MKKFRIMFSILVSVLTPDHTFWRAGSCIYHFTTALPTAVRGSGGRKQGVRPREWRCALEGKRKAAVNRVRGRIQSSMLECSAQRASWQAEGCDPLGKLLTLASTVNASGTSTGQGIFCSPCGVAGGLLAAGHAFAQYYAAGGVNRASRWSTQHSLLRCRSVMAKVSKELSLERVPPTRDLSTLSLPVRQSWDPPWSVCASDLAVQCSPCRPCRPSNSGRSGSVQGPRS
ncbi:hypothetical protein B0J14DRAFT_73719 [Halenospora varia]|nr:hypothetical protein B0J14DRAFT_73719 [Halenospora varia]